MKESTFGRLIGCAGLVALVGTAFSGVIGGSPAGASSAPITIGVIYDGTGLGAPSINGSQIGAEARIDAQNAAGGVNGHKLKVVLEDSTSTGTGDQTAAQYLIEDKDAFGIIEDSTFTFGATAYLQQNGIPVVGYAYDGPEWGEQPNDNMFSVSGVSITPFNGTYYSYTSQVAFMKDIGVTKIADVELNLPSGATAMEGIEAAATRLGLQNCYDNDTTPIGTANLTAVALEIKSAGCNGVVMGQVLTSDIALSQALKNEGFVGKQYYYTAYDQNLLSNPTALRATIGDYTSPLSHVLYNPASPTGAVKTMLDNLKKYTKYSGGIPSSYTFLAYEAADLFIKGLQLAGKNPTRSAFIADLHKLGSYTAGGLLPPPGVSFQHFGTLAMLPKTGCSQFAEITLHGYVPYRGGAYICGARFPVPSS